MTDFWVPAQLAVFAKVVELNGFSAARSALCWVEIARLIYSLEASLEMQYRYWSDLKKS